MEATDIIHILITLLGFYFSSKHLSKKIDSEIRHSKEIKTVSKLENCHHIILEAMIVSFRNNEFMYEKVDEMLKFYNKIYSYGSLDAIKLIAAINNHISNTSLESMDRVRETNLEYQILVLNILLASQIKYDVTGVIVNPKYWILTTGNIEYWDYDYIMELINKTIDELNLMEEFKIKDYKI